MSLSPCELRSVGSFRMMATISRRGDARPRFDHGPCAGPAIIMRRPSDFSLLFRALHRSAQPHHPIDGDDFDVLGLDRKVAIVLNGLADPASQVDILRLVGLIHRRHVFAVAIAHILRAVVGRGLIARRQVIGRRGIDSDTAPPRSVAEAMMRLLVFSCDSPNETDCWLDVRTRLCIRHFFVNAETSTVECRQRALCWHFAVDLKEKYELSCQVADITRRPIRVDRRVMSNI